MALFVQSFPDQQPQSAAMGGNILLHRNITAAKAQ
jgi:hypothetical protein